MTVRAANSEIKLSFTSTITNTLDSGAKTSATISASTLVSGKITNGIETNEANRSWASIDRQLGDGANETLDLYQMTGLDIGAGAGNDALGQACLFENAVAIIIE